MPKGTLSGRRSGSSRWPPVVMGREDLGVLVELLGRDRDVVAPTLGDAALVLTKVTSATEIAFGYRDRQSPGEYKLLPPEGDDRFSFNHGPDSPKKFLHPSRLTLFSVAGTDGKGRLVENRLNPRPLAFFGLSPCDLQAIRVLDRVFLSSLPDTYYARLRQGAFVLAVNCTHPGGTCFCASMGTGPRALPPFDLCLTELAGGLLLEAGSAEAVELLTELPVKVASGAAVREADDLVGAAARKMGRHLDTAGLPEVLRQSLESPVWDVMKDWCLGCTNCTIVCPTCFCYDLADKINLQADAIERERIWDSCFTWQFAAAHGTNFRSTLRARYRHWLCHKLSYWVEQYGMFGCVGCGRCITWCPVKIDITEVAKAVRGKHYDEPS